MSPSKCDETFTQICHSLKRALLLLWWYVFLNLLSAPCDWRCSLEVSDKIAQPDVGIAGSWEAREVTGWRRRRRRNGGCHNTTENDAVGSRTHGIKSQIFSSVPFGTVHIYISPPPCSFMTFTEWVRLFPSPSCKRYLWIAPYEFIRFLLRIWK